MKINWKLCWLLFCTNCSISAFTFGGGYVVIPMMRKYFVEGRHLITEDELMDMAAVSQSTPGAIAVNLASLVGRRIAGLPGAVASCIGSVLPPLVILSVISTCYRAFRSSAAISAVLRGMEAGVAALIVDLVLDMSRGVFHQKNPLLTLLVPLSSIASFFFQINVLIILLACGALCLAQPWLALRKGGVANE